MKLFTRQQWDAEMRQRAEKMIADGTMPPLEQVLKAVAETRAKYAPLILAARKEKQKAAK
jgi:hypothetical protein